MKPDSAKASIDEIRDQPKSVREAVVAIEFKLSELEAALQSQAQAPARGARSTAIPTPADTPRNARPLPRNGPRSSGSFGAAGEQMHGAAGRILIRLLLRLQTR